MKKTTGKTLIALLLVLNLFFTLATGCGQSAPTTSPNIETSANTTTGISNKVDNTTTALVADSSTTSANEDFGATTNESTPSSTSTIKTTTADAAKATTTTTTTKTTTTTTVLTGAALNGVPLSSYTIVYDNKVDYALRAAQYIREKILERVGVELKINSDLSPTTSHEIVVGDTVRPISDALSAPEKKTKFSLLAKDGSVAMEGDYFVIAAAAYYFVETYITGKVFSVSVPTAVKTCEPIVKKPKNFIILIGDGMGVWQTKLFNEMSASQLTTYSDNESFFYGYMLPYTGYHRTNSLSGITDSAAGGTALATGHKTINKYVGLDKNKNELVSLTEIAGSLGMSTAVMSTEPQTGATPAAFSAHADNRTDTTTILNTQTTLVNKYGTIINCDYNLYDSNGIDVIENNINNTLEKLSKNNKGFFLMYEEAYIDKHCHNNDKEMVFKALVRFNQAIGVFMEYAFYHPDTFVLITADHETGAMKQEGNSITFSNGDHSSQSVPVFAYGMGGELFRNKIIENVQIPKTISAFWGKEIVDPDTITYPALK